jgi:hypothetical protein
MGIRCLHASSREVSMAVDTHADMTGALMTPVELGAKFIRWGFGLFVFGLVIGFVPMAHYMHGSFETVGEAFLKNVTLWWGCAWTLAVYVTQIGSLAMIVIGLCYVVLARDGAMTSIVDTERMAPALCAGGIIAEVVAGFAGHYAVLAVWPNFYYAPVRHGIWAWLGLQAVCIAIYIAGVVYASGGIKRALHALTGRAPNLVRAQR